MELVVLSKLCAIGHILKQLHAHNLLGDKQHIFCCFNILCIVMLLEPQLLSQERIYAIGSSSFQNRMR